MNIFDRPITETLKERAKFRYVRGDRMEKLAILFGLLKFKYKVIDVEPQTDDGRYKLQFIGGLRLINPLSWLLVAVVLILSCVVLPVLTFIAIALEFFASILFERSIVDSVIYTSKQSLSILMSLREWIQGEIAKARKRKGFKSLGYLETMEMLRDEILS